MGSTLFSWAVAGSREASEASDGPVAALGRLPCLFRRSVLVVPAAGDEGWETLRLARSREARVTALCPTEQAARAREAGAEFVLDPARTDPTWYPGAWAVIVDPGDRIGYARARRSLGPGGVYVAARPSVRDRALALFDRLSGGPRLLRSR
jgi:NADPH:quinone reductase-like Zn-dependent oxidoreductase